MANLSENPTGTDLEDFVSAHLASRGAFVETGVTERDPQDILELDVVWTDYRNPEVPRIPVEIKSREWHLGELFKYYGWTRYLDLPPGFFVCRQMPSRVKQDSLVKLAGRIGVQILHIDDLEKSDERFAIFGLPDPAARHLPALWRFSFWAQRRLLRSLSLAIGKSTCPASAREAKDYFKLINDATFFEPDVRTRVSLLLDAHTRHPKLARSAAAEMDGKEVNFDDPPDTKLFRRALFYGAHFPVQACLYLAHKARLALVKAAVDFIIARRRGTLPQHIVQIFDMEIDLGDSVLYRAFHHAVEIISRAPTFHQYPVFWQVFLWAWGGFILEDRRDDEYAALSAQTLIPIGEIDTAFGVFDALFPIDGGWFAQPGEASRKVLKLMPAAMRGIGAYGRLMQYGQNEYKKLGYRDGTTVHLANDHNSTARLLDGSDDELIS